MRLQTKAGCAPSAIVNALEAIGIHRSERVVRIDCGTTAAKGTTQHGIKQALERAEVSYQEINEPGVNAAVQALFEHATSVGSAILCTEGGEHWEAVIGVTAESDRIIVFNSDRHASNRAKNGVHLLTRRQLANYWAKCEGMHYAILLLVQP